MREAGASTSRMSATDFFDSNVLLYLISPDATKAGRAEDLVADGGIISVQVLNEFASVASSKFHMAMSDIRAVLGGIRSACDVVPTDTTTHELGLDIAERYKFSIYDSMLLAAAQQARCTTFFTEDLHHGQKIGGLTIRDPFRP
jgi:predicted nucleic acid-binding protein